MQLKKIKISSEYALVFLCCFVIYRKRDPAENIISQILQKHKNVYKLKRLVSA